MSFVVLPGDGIGPAVIEQALRVLDAVGYDEPRLTLPFGLGAHEALGSALPEETLAALREHGLALLGAGGTVKGAAQPSSILRLRAALGLDVLVRPTIVAGQQLTLVCSTLEGLYQEADVDTADGVVHRRVVRTSGVRRLLDEAGRIATRRLTVVDKPSVFHRTRALFERSVSDLASDVPTEIVNADAFVAALVRSPSQYDVVVALSFVGDLLSDLLAALGDGLGTVASQAIGEGGVTVFEPVHGTAPRRVDEAPLRVNPTGAIRAAELLLRHRDQGERADAIGAALSDPARPHTPDEGGEATTAAVGDALVARLRGRP